MAAHIHHQLHGYRGGHQLLHSSVRLDGLDQDVVDHLSDLAGPLRPGERFGDYISTYPLPSGEYYAFAKTEQDAAAPRSGCVVTRTLLVPMDYWQNTASPVRLARLIERPVESGSMDVRGDRLVDTIETVEDLVTRDIIDAMFLEKRNPIVVFGAPEAEKIALRLLTALWPVMRRTFSLCTFALSPRTLLGRSFDLVFSPRSVRARFSDWEGRRIVANRNNDGDRHRWSSVLATRVFGSREPCLTNDDSVRALIARCDDSDGEGLLRMCLRWEELKANAHRSPTAVLGLVDIANSRKGRHAWDAVQSAVARGVGTAVAMFSVESAWEFLSRLLGKLGNREVANYIYKSVGRAGVELAERDWRLALKWVSGESWIDSRLGDEVIRAVAGRIGRNKSEKVTRMLVSVPSDRLVKMALLEEAMLDRLFVSTEVSADQALMRYVREGIRRLKSGPGRSSMSGFLERVRDDRDSGLLEDVVTGLSSVDLVAATNIIWGLKSRRSWSLGDVLCSAAEIGGSREEVRTAFARFDADEQTDRCIARLLILDTRDVDWLIDSSGLGERRSLFLNELIEDVSDHELETVFGHAEETARRSLQLLVGNLRQCARSAARLVCQSTVAARDRIAFGVDILPAVGEGSERRRLAESMVASVLNEPSLHTGEMRREVVCLVIQDVDFGTIVDGVLGVQSSGDQVGRALAVFGSLCREIGEPLARHVGHVVKVVAQREQFDIGTEGARAIAGLMENAKEAGCPNYVEICSTILPYAMASRSEPASRIVVAAFPMVYEALRNGKNLFWQSGFFNVFDWDRCKVARRELVRSFLDSEWPAIDLGIVGDRARDLVRILRRLLKEPSGFKYLGRIEEGAGQLESRSAKRIISAIREVRG